MNLPHLPPQPLPPHATNNVSCDRCIQFNIICIREVSGRICNSCAKSKKGCFIGEVSVRTLDLDGTPRPLSARAKKDLEKASGDSSSPSTRVPKTKTSRRKSSLRSSPPAIHGETEAPSSLEESHSGLGYSERFFSDNTQSTYSGLDNSYDSLQTDYSQTAIMSDPSQNYTYKLSDTERGFGGVAPTLPHPSQLPSHVRTMDDTRAYLTDPLAPAPTATILPSDPATTREFSFVKSSQAGNINFPLGSTYQVDNVHTAIDPTLSSTGNSSFNNGHATDPLTTRGASSHFKPGHNLFPTVQDDIEDDAEATTAHPSSSYPQGEATSTPPSSMAQSSPTKKRNPVIDRSILTQLPQIAPPLEIILCCNLCAPKKSAVRNRTDMEVQNICQFIQNTAGEIPHRRVNSDGPDPIPWAQQDFIYVVIDDTNSHMSKPTKVRWFGVRQRGGGEVNVLEMVKGVNGPWPVTTSPSLQKGEFKECLIRRQGIDLVCKKHRAVDYSVYLADWRAAGGLGAPGAEWKQQLEEDDD